MGIYLWSNKALQFKGLILSVVPGHLDFRNDLVISTEVVRNALHFKTSATPLHSKWLSKKLLLIQNHGNSAAAAIPHWGHKSDITRGFLTVERCQGSFSSALGSAQEWGSLHPSSSHEVRKSNLPCPRGASYLAGAGLLWRWEWDSRTNFFCSTGVTVN